MKRAASSGRWSAFWQQRSARERRILLAGGMVLALLLGWWLLLDPALQGRTYWQQALPALRADHLQMQAMARQASELPAPSSTATRPMPDRAALEQSLLTRGLRPQSLTLSGDTLQLTLADVSFSALTEWLQQTQRDAQLLVTEASLSARERLDRVDASLTLSRSP